jgi:GH15 family glucan-1,4-alpha-glucosidase
MASLDAAVPLPGAAGTLVRCLKRSVACVTGTTVYAWIRDAAFSVYALRRIGHNHEAGGFLSWALVAVECDGQPHVLYDLDRNARRAEITDPELEAYRQSASVRWGNGAAHQVQHDVYREILICAYHCQRTTATRTLLFGSASGCRHSLCSRT